ncbi:hypothetical protein EPUL_005750, partial [Erysiphe pulchra]
NVDSTLASFKEDVEKEEVVAFKAYLRLAIANYAAADSSPAPPTIPTHSRPSKSNGSGYGKEKSAPKKKKARVSQSTKPQVTQMSNTNKRLTNKNQSPSTTTTDTRLFVRLPQEHEWRKLSLPGASSYYGQGEDIEKWAEKHHLICLIIGEPTHRAGNTLDLAWMNVKDTIAWVCKEECKTSDHLPICGFVPISKVATINSLSSGRKLRVSKDKVPQSTRLVTEWLPPSTTLNTIEEIEKIAQDICWALTNSLKAVGKRPNKATGKKAPWWTPECKFAHLEYKEAVKDAERNLRARKFRNTVASAKREHWKSRIEDLKSSRDAYKLMQ